MRAITLAPLDEARKRMPGLDDMLVNDPNSVMQQIVQIKESPTAQVGKPYLRIGIAYSCETCRAEMEKQLAKAPSWMIVEINRGPRDSSILST